MCFGIIYFDGKFVVDVGCCFVVVDLDCFVGK